MAIKKPVMPPDCCGSCFFAHDVKGKDFLMCMALPPAPMDEGDDGFRWIRGGHVNATDPRCWYFQPKVRN